MLTVHPKLHVIVATWIWVICSGFEGFSEVESNIQANAIGNDRAIMVSTKRTTWLSPRKTWERTSNRKKMIYWKITPK